MKKIEITLAGSGLQIDNIRLLMLAIKPGPFAEKIVYLKYIRETVSLCLS